MCSSDWLTNREDVREDVYAVFVRVQDEQHALSADYTRFAEAITAAIKDQLARRDLIDKHLAAKARQGGKRFDQAIEDLKTAYS